MGFLGTCCLIARQPAKSKMDDEGEGTVSGESGVGSQDKICLHLERVILNVLTV